MWPDVAEHLDEGSTGQQVLQRIGQALRRQRITVHYPHARLFLVFCGAKIRKSIVGDEAAGAMMENEDNDDLCKLDESYVTETLEHVRLAVGKVSPIPPPESESATALFCGQIAASLRQLRKLFDAKLAALKDSQTMTPTAASLPQLWHEFGEAPDTDAAKAFIMSMGNFHMQKLSASLKEIPSALDEFANELDGLTASLNALTYDEDEVEAEHEEEE